MSNYDEYYRRAKLLASVHGLSTWSTSTHTRANDDEDGEDLGSDYDFENDVDV